MWLKKIAIGIAGLGLIVGLGACSDNQSPSGQDNQANEDSYSRLVKAAPAHPMTYPITRNTINGWIDTWNKPNAVSYNYLEAVDGDKLVTLGYYALKGLPVSMCTGLTPPAHVWQSNNGNVLMPNPGMDGVFYSGGDCQRYYGFDANTGQYIEYSVPYNIMVRTTNAPLDNVTAPNLGPSGSK